MLRFSSDVRYPNASSPSARVRTRDRRRSHTRTVEITPATSWPYAPMFCTGAAPTVPGMPESASTPTHSSATARATSSSQSCPAGAWKLAPPHESSASTVIPRRRSRTTTPPNPSSPTSRFEPPPITRSGSPASSAACTVSSSSASLCASTYRSAGPPTRRVVSSANEGAPTASGRRPGAVRTISGRSRSTGVRGSHVTAPA